MSHILKNKTSSPKKNQPENFSKEILDTITRSISDAILALDTNGNILFFNAKFSLLFPSINSSKLLKFRKIFHDSQMVSAFTNALKNGSIEKVKATKLKTVSGYRYYSLSVSAFHGRNNEVFGAVGVFHDVTELKEAEQIRIDFVANVSHEIRTPLTSIKGYANTIAEDLKSSRPIMPEFVEPIIRNCERLENITKDLLDLSILDAKHTLDKEKINLKQITKKIFQTLDDKFRQREQTATCKIDCLELNGDPHRVEQVLTNLLENASKYTPTGGIIHAHWFQTKQYIILEVRDNGPGIAHEHLPRLFERFYRVDKGRSRNLGGTGLGLAIVKHIMMAHNGRVNVTSELGIGSVFRCEFPIPF